MLDRVRRDNPTAFLYGYTMRYEEPKNGLDTSLSLSRNRRFLSFQFKRPHKQNDDIFWFKFNDSTKNLQHNIMHVTASATVPMSTVFYALPAYFSMNDFEFDSPDFLQHTYFIDILDTPPILDFNSHDFEIDTINLTFQIHSDSILGEGRIYTWNDIIEKFHSKKIGIESSLFKQKIKEYHIENESSLFKQKNKEYHIENNLKVSKFDEEYSSNVFLKALVL